MRSCHMICKIFVGGFETTGHCHAWCGGASDWTKCTHIQVDHREDRVFTVQKTPCLCQMQRNMRFKDLLQLPNLPRSGPEIARLVLTNSQEPLSDYSKQMANLIIKLIELCYMPTDQQ